MSNLDPNKSRRFPLRVVPEDKLLLERSLQLTVLPNVSELVRAALTLLKQVWIARNPQNRIILVDIEQGLRYDLAIPSASVESAERLRAKSSKTKMIEIRLSPADDDCLKSLVAMGAASNEAQAVRRALNVYSHVIDRYSQGFRLAVQTPKGDLVFIDVPGVNTACQGKRQLEEEIEVDRGSGRGGDGGPVALVISDSSERELESELHRRDFSVHTYKYEHALGPEENLRRALKWAEEQVSSLRRTGHSDVKCFVDLCWDMAGRDLSPSDWGTVENISGKLVASFAGFKFIESAARANWGNSVGHFFYMTRYLNELISRRPNFLEREEEFREKVGDHDMLISVLTEGSSVRDKLEAALGMLNN